MAGAITLTVNKAGIGMQCARPVYTKEGVKLIENGTILTTEVLESLSKNKIPFVTVMQGKGGAPELANNKINTSSLTIEENGKKILKMDSHQAKESLSILSQRLENFFDNVKTDNKLDLANIKKEIDNTLDKVFENKEAYTHLSMLKMKNHNLYVHSVDVAILSSLIAKEFGFSDNDVKDVAICGLLHDVGKILMPNNLFDKGTLTDAELITYSKHPFFGYEILKKENFEERFCNSVFEHHENFDGMGFPMKKYGVDSDIYSRIINLCNVFSNLTRHSTPYKAAQQIITGTRKKFDPDIVQIFQKVIGIYPNNTCVKLSDGSLARIIQQNTILPLRPVVSLLKDADGIVPAEIITINLVERRDLVITKILD